MLAFINQFEVDATNFLSQGRWTSLPYIGTLRRNEYKERINSEEVKDLVDAAKETLDKIDNMYDDMASTYKSIFYNERHNCFLGEMGAGMYLYDPFQTQFINEHRLFNKKNNLECLMLTDEFTDPKRRIKYERSVYRFIERK